MDTIIGSMTALVTPFKNGKLDLENKKFPIIKKVVMYEQVNGTTTVRASLIYVFGVLVYMYVSNKL